MNAKRYRERKSSSGNKTDRHDAWALADALRMDGHAWRALTALDPIIAELRILCRDEVALIEERTTLIKQLQAALHEYCPSAMEAFEDWTCPGAWAFVQAFPSAAALGKAGKRKWEPERSADSLPILSSKNAGKSSSTATGFTARRPMQARIATFENAGE